MKVISASVCLAQDRGWQQALGPRQPTLQGIQSPCFSEVLFLMTWNSAFPHPRRKDRTSCLRRRPTRGAAAGGRCRQAPSAVRSSGCALGAGWAPPALIPARPGLARELGTSRASHVWHVERGLEGPASWGACGWRGSAAQPLQGPPAVELGPRPGATEHSLRDRGSRPCCAGFRSVSHHIPSIFIPRTFVLRPTCCARHRALEDWWQAALAPRGAGPRWRCKLIHSASAVSAGLAGCSPRWIRPHNQHLRVSGGDLPPQGGPEAALGRGRAAEWVRRATRPGKAEHCVY